MFIVFAFKGQKSSIENAKLIPETSLSKIFTVLQIEALKHFIAMFIVEG